MPSTILCRGLGLPVLRDIGFFFREWRKSLAERLSPPPIESVDSLTVFCRTRAAFIAQTSLFGYLKTRMGTRYRDIFVDDAFSAAIRSASVRLFASCLSDLTVFAVATVGQSAGLGKDEAAALAVRCFEAALADGVPDGFEDVSAGAPPAFRERVAQTDWAAAAVLSAAFSGSEKDLIDVAPVVDTFKQQDAEIVGNSIRYRWRDVREQVRKRVDAEAVRDDWRRMTDPLPGATRDDLSRHA